MSERGLPVVDGAPACPFVAFDDDRDGRSTAPDHRHRCFAEPTPAPRALAHQDAYCLSPAFAVCPTFQDWARREAAAARVAPAAGPAARPPRDVAPLAAPAFYDDADDEADDAAYRDGDTANAAHDDDRYMPPAAAGRDGQRQPVEPVNPIPPRRGAQREWAAPPPWLGEDGAAPEAAPLPASTAPGAIPGWGTGAAATLPPSGGRSRGRDDGPSAAGRGLAGSAADRLAGPDPDAPVAARPQRTYAPPPADDLDDDAWAPAPVVEPGRGPAPIPGRGAPPPGARRQAGRRPAPRDAARDGARPQPQRDPGDLFGPAWEQPRRYEAYPSLRTRVGLPSFGGIPRVGVAALAIVAAAVILFLVGPLLLGLGGKSPTTATTTPSPSASSPGPSEVASPTVRPAATPQIYTVVANDTLTRIATKFGITLKALKAANPQIKDQNSITVGEKLTIPVPPGTTGGAGGTVGGASPSASP